MAQRNKKIFALLIIGLFGLAGIVRAQTSPSTLYVPLIGITSVPDPLALQSPADVTYSYAVKNFLAETPLTDVSVSDDHCASVVFVDGDDNGDGSLDSTETWRYRCITKVSVTTQSIATATGMANNLTATHKAYATVVVGSENPAPLVSIINITKVANPLSLPATGGDIVFTYKVNNPGAVPLSHVTVVDDKCDAMSSKLGDTNGNNFLDVTEVWIYTCKTHLYETTTNIVSVSASANGLTAVGYASLTVNVAVPKFPDTGSAQNIKIIIWFILAGILGGLLIFFRVNKHQQP